ncbi:MAG TPA: response regulator [Dongiaceae bacterium]|nr:response regulator [Dongiaceae bacterium]
MEAISHLLPQISILLIEDEEVTLELLSIMLSKKFPDIVLHTAINGRTGLELFKTYTPDIVITDINMPQMGGVQAAQAIRSIKPDSKIVAITGKNEKSVLQDSVGNGFEFDHFIMKPVVFQDMFEAIEQCLNDISRQ